MNRNILKVIAIATMLTLSSGMAFAANGVSKGSATKMGKSESKMELENYDDMGNEDFEDADFELQSKEDLLKELKEEIGEINQKDLATLGALYDQIIVLEKTEKFEEAEKLWEQLDEILVKYFDGEDYEIADFELLSKEDFLKEIKEEIEKIDEADLAKLGSLYDQIIVLEEAEDYDGAEKLWEQIDDILNKYFDDEDYEDYELLSKEDFLKEIKDEIEKIDEADLSKLGSLYEKIIALEKAENYDGADKLWEQLDNILNKYYDGEDFKDGDMEDKDLQGEE